MLDTDSAWDAIVEMRGGLQVPARLLPLARLLEVAIHHVDLDIGYEISDIDSQTAEWLLEWCSFRLRNRVEFPNSTCDPIPASRSWSAVPANPSPSAAPAPTCSAG